MKSASNRRLSPSAAATGSLTELSPTIILKIQELNRVKPNVGFNLEVAQKEVPMKKMILISILLSTFFSVAAVAEEHADAALKHTNMAVQEGKAGHNAELTKHAKEALPHAIKAAEVAEGEAKTHLQAAIDSLKAAIEDGKMQGKEHGKTATKAAEEAAEHLKAGNQGFSMTPNEE